MDGVWLQQADVDPSDSSKSSSPMALDDTMGDDGDAADNIPPPQQGHQQTSHTTTTAMAAVQEDPTAVAAAVSVSGVEEYVRRHYLQQGFEGYHCENRLFMTLYGLLFWDVIHGPLQAEQRSDTVATGPNAADAAAAGAGSADDGGASSAAVVIVEETEDKEEEEAARGEAGAVADTDITSTSTVPFTSAYQDTPHDLHHGSEFISRRRKAVAATLAEIEEDDEGGRGMERLLRAAFYAHYGEQSRYVQWDWRDAQLQSAKRSSSRASGGGADDQGGGNATGSAASAGDARTPAGPQEEQVAGQEEEQDPAQHGQQVLEGLQEEEEEAEEEEEGGLKASTAVALAELIGLCRGLGSRAVAGMCRLYAESYETWAGGLPDLLIWRPPQHQHRQEQKPSDAVVAGTAAAAAGTPAAAAAATAVSAADVESAAGAWDVRLVEVKGPGDSLSHRQRAWIDRLVGWGVSVCVCHVVAVDHS
eukprot:COSAG06_NODE_1069_length_10828_cov_22.835493_9_plen_476_part_00